MQKSNLNEIDVTFFVPCLNEQQNVTGAIETICTAVGQTGCSYEIIIVDDQSTDNSAQVIEQYMAQHPQLPMQLVRKEKRQGLGRNFADVAFIGRGKYYKFVGASNQEHPDDIAAMLKKIGEVDLILPYLAVDGRSLLRRSVSMLFTKTVNLITGYSLKYYNGSAIHKRYDVMRWHSYSSGSCYEADLIIRLLGEGATYCEVPTRVSNRGSGKTKVFKTHNVLSVLHGLLQIFLQTLRVKLFGR